MVRKTRPIWIWFHKWTALILGLWIVLNGLSGTLLVFQRKIEANLDLDLYRTGQPYETADFAVMTEAVGAAYPGMSFHKVERDNKYADEAYRFTLSPDGEPQSYFTDLEVFVKPVTGEILGDRPWLTFMKATRLFHMELLAGHTGETVMGYMAIFLTISIFVGVVLWWPKNGKYKRALQVKSASGTPRLMRDLHNVAGMYFLIVLGMVCITGLTVVFPRQAQAVVELFLPTPPTQPFSVSEPTGSPVSLARAAAAVEASYPGAVPTLIGMPLSDRGTYSFRIEPAGLDFTVYTSVIYIDQYTGEIVSAFDPVTQSPTRSLIGLWSIYSHNGQMFGMAGRLLVFGSGIAIAVLFGSGIYIWLRKRKTTYAKPTHTAKATLIDRVPAE